MQARHIVLSTLPAIPPMSKASPTRQRPYRARPNGGLAEAGWAAWGSLRRDLALREASGAPAGRRLSRLRLSDTGYLGLAPLICAKLMRQKGWEESFFASAVLSSCVAGVIANVATRSSRMLKAATCEPTRRSLRGYFPLKEPHAPYTCAELHAHSMPKRPRPVGAPRCSHKKSPHEECCPKVCRMSYKAC